MCRLVYGKRLSYLQNDDLVIIFNLFIERALLEKVESFSYNYSSIPMAVLIKVVLEKSNLGEYVEVEKVVEKLKDRTEESYEILEEATAHGNYLELKHFKLFYFSNNIWHRIKGEKVQKSPFGWWVMRKGIAKRFEINTSKDVLICTIEN